MENTVMKKMAFIVCAAAISLSAGRALANHCDEDLASVSSALATASSAEPNALDAAASLLDRATGVCQDEEAAADPSLADPAYITLGRSMLIAAKQLLSGNP